MIGSRWTRGALVAPVVGACLVITGVMVWATPWSDTSSQAGATADGTTAVRVIASAPTEQVTVTAAAGTTAASGPAASTPSTVSAPTTSDAPEMTVSPSTSPVTEVEPATAPVTAVSPAVTSPPPLAVPPPLGQQSAAVESLPMRQHVAPVALALDAQSISAPIVPVGAEATDGELEIPATSTQIGWYQFGSAPGEAGSAVLAAHVDWKGSLGVFYNLRTVAVGSIAVVTLEDGSSVRFSVTEVIEIDKGAIPDDRIFRRDGPPQLVLITCGGHFNSQTHHYDDNIIAFANPI